eukprot:s738_g8.t2
MRKVFQILCDRKYDILMVAADAGESFGDLTTKYLGRLHKEKGTMIAVCTKHYGEELKFALDYEKFVTVLPLRVDDTYPPEPAGGPDHEYDKEHLAQGYILSVFKPSVVFLECREKSEREIAAKIANFLQRHKVAKDGSSAPQPLYPTLDRLKPPSMKAGWVGKYGDPRDGELWDWYTVQGRSEVHERAPQFSTGRLAERKIRKDRPRMQLHRPFNSRSCRIRDVQERQDHIVSITLSDGVSCRLFIPKHLRELFKEEEGLLQKLPPTDQEAPFTILTPSFSRSALDEEVGLLDLSASMVRDNGQPVKFLHIVAVKASEVEKYRSSAPFFVIMELPTSVTLQHEKYGAKSPEELGVGCARHWLVRLAISLKLQYAFFLDDSVRSWRGVTLVEDQHCLFGSPSGSKAQFKQIPMTRVMEYLAEPEFLAQEMSKFVAFGFARLAPELMLSRRAFCPVSHTFNVFRVHVW